jgi:hypothetical protein
VTSTLSTVVWLIGGIAVIVLAASTAIVVRGRKTPLPPAAPAPAAAPPQPAMSGLESALSQVTGRDGRAIGEHIDAEAGHVDALRIPDDTGPVLRRVLDHLEHHDAPAGGSDDGGSGVDTDPPPEPPRDDRRTDTSS